MRSTGIPLALPFAFLAALAIPACGGGSDSDDTADDTGDDTTVPDADPSCQPATVLPTAYRPIAEISEGVVAVTTTGGVTSGTIDATAGGLSGAADNPYIYIDLDAGMKVAIDDIDALTSTEWDLALKRSSLRANGGDSGPGNRKIAIVPDATLDDVTAAPTTGYTTDDFADENCELVTIPGGEPMSAFGEWYLYDEATHAVTPKPDVYVVERNNGSHVAVRFVTYYGDVEMPMRGAFYQVEWKDL